jgi:glycosyltransferase involved in cell wall biosynthesis
MTRKRLLFVSPRFLFPSDSGGKIRTRDILRGLKGGAFEVTLVSPAADESAARYAEDLERVCDRFVAWPEALRGLAFRFRRWIAVASSLPVPVASDRSSAGRRALSREIQRGYDLVVADFPHSTVLLPDGINVSLLLFTHNVEAEIFRRHSEVSGNWLMRAMWASQTRKMEAFETGAACRADGVVAVSERDAAHFRSVTRADRVFLIPTGVDLEYFPWADARAQPAHRGGRVVFTGSMDWGANVDGIRYFMDEIWPRIVAKSPEVTMTVVGHSPPRMLVERAVERGLAWTFTGFVDDVRVHVRDADVYVIPLRVGGGTRIKAFEAMAMGCPVVSTSIGVEGLPVSPGRHFLAADTAEAFAGAVLELLANRELRRVIATNARELVASRYSHKAAAAAFEEACMRTAALRPSHGSHRRIGVQRITAAN